MEPSDSEGALAAVSTACFRAIDGPQSALSLSHSLRNEFEASQMSLWFFSSTASSETEGGSAVRVRQMH
jgi:hypothetical protein